MALKEGALQPFLLTFLRPAKKVRRLRDETRELDFDSEVFKVGLNQ